MRNYSAHNPVKVERGAEVIRLCNVAGQTTKCYKSFDRCPSTPGLSTPFATPAYSLQRKNVVMALITLILAISIALTAIQFESAESRLNRLPTNVFQIRTTEAAPAASPGNNLNVARLNEEDFQAISTASSAKSKKQAENDESNSNQVNIKEIFNPIKPQRLVWDDCLETSFRDNQRNLQEAQKDLEIVADYRIYHPKETNIFEDVLPNWSKRGDKNVNNSAALLTWIEKYKDLHSKAEERRAQKPEPISIKKITTTIHDNFRDLTTPVPNTESSYISDEPKILDKPKIPNEPKILNEPKMLNEPKLSSIVPTFFITRDLFKESILPNVTQAVTESNVIASYTEDWFDVRNKTKIRFSSLPKRDTYLVPTLRLHEGFYPFSFISEFFYLIYPFDFPVGKWFCVIFTIRDYLIKHNSLGV